jgi:hypothetical protein
MAYRTGRLPLWLRLPSGTNAAKWDKSTRQDGTLSRSGFRWDKRRGVYICPNNKVLRTSGAVHEGRTLRYRASSSRATNESG